MISLFYSLPKIRYLQFIKFALSEKVLIARPSTHGTFHKSQRFIIVSATYHMVSRFLRSLILRFAVIKSFPGSYNFWWHCKGGGGGAVVPGLRPNLWTFFMHKTRGGPQNCLKSGKLHQNPHFTVSLPRVPGDPKTKKISNFRKIQKFRKSQNSCKNPHRPER